jgi:sugar phosphate isomerase/epimerase
MKPTCFSTLGCAEFDWPAVAALAHRHALRKVELRALADRLDLPAYLQAHYGEPAAFAARVRADGLTVPVLDTSLNLHRADAAAREAFLAFIPWAEALGTHFLRVFDGGTFSPAANAAPSFAPAYETLAWWRELRARNGWHVDMIIETHDSLCSAAEIVRFQQGLTEPAGILWDTWHTWFKAHEAPADTWRVIAPWVAHVHFKDGLRQPIGEHAYRYVPPGQGVYPLAELDALLAAAGYTGSRSLEWERKWHPYLPPLEVALLSCRGD